MRAAVNIYKVARKFRVWMNKRFVGCDLSQFDIGIGPHTGEALVGNMGPAVRTGARHSLQVKGRLQTVETYEILHGDS